MYSILHQIFVKAVRMQAIQTASGFIRSESYLHRHLLYENFFNPEECDQISYLDLNVLQAEVSYQLPEKANPTQLNLKHRNALNKAIPRLARHEWIYGRLINTVKEANERYFHFELTSLSDPQILEYQNTGFYGTHVDVGTGQISLRKLTMVAFLTPPEEYQGGELILKPYGGPLPAKQGSLVIFPSYLPHEVRPVRQGIRRTLVTWILGPCLI